MRVETAPYVAAQLPNLLQLSTRRENKQQRGMMLSANREEEMTNYCQLWKKPNDIPLFNYPKYHHGTMKLF